MDSWLLLLSLVLHQQQKNPPLRLFRSHLIDTTDTIRMNIETLWDSFSLQIGSVSLLIVIFRFMKRMRNGKIETLYVCKRDNFEREKLLLSASVRSMVLTQCVNVQPDLSLAWAPWICVVLFLPVCRLKGYYRALKQIPKNIATRFVIMALHWLPVKFRVEYKLANSRFRFPPPWYNRHGWLGVKNHLSIYLSRFPLLSWFSSTKIFHLCWNIDHLYHSLSGPARNVKLLTSLRTNKDTFDQRSFQCQTQLCLESNSLPLQVRKTNNFFCF